MDLNRRVFESVVISAVLLIAVADESFKMAVEGNGTELKCRTNSTFGVDWHFKKINGSSQPLKIYDDETIPHQFAVHYSLKVINDSSDKVFILSVKDIDSSHAGIYECKEGVTQSVLATTRLAVITSVTCSFGDRNFTVEASAAESLCEFSVIGSNSSYLPQGICLPGCTPWHCDSLSGEGPCAVTLTFVGGISHALRVTFSDTMGDLGPCNLTCLSEDNATTYGPFNGLSETFRFKVSVQCWKLDLLISTSALPITPTSSFELELFPIAVGTLSGFIMVMIVIVIVIALRLKKKKSGGIRSEERVVSEFGVYEEEKIYEEIQELDKISDVDYYNITSTSKTGLANSTKALTSSAAKGEENNDYQNDCYALVDLKLYRDSNDCHEKKIGKIV